MLLNTWSALLIIVSKLGSPVSNNIHVTLMTCNDVCNLRMQLVVPIGYGVWVWCDMTLSIIKLLTVRSPI